MAESTADIKSTTLGGVGAGSFAAGGSVSTNVIENQVDAYVSGGAHIEAGAFSRCEGDWCRRNLSDCRFRRRCCRCCGWPAVSTNRTRNRLHAYLNDARVTGRTANVHTSDNSDIDAITVGGAGAGGFAAGGSVSTNEIGNVLDAHVSNAAVNLSGGLSVWSTDESDILAIAPGGAGCGRSALAQRIHQ